MNISLNNYNKPSHPLFKRIGDICLVAIPIYAPVILSLPLTGNTKAWVVSIAGGLLATVKLVSKFTVDPSYKDSTEVKNISTTTMINKE
jgi:hypothetical protein